MCRWLSRFDVPTNMFKFFCNAAPNPMKVVADADAWTLPMFKGVTGVDSCLLRFTSECAAARAGYVQI